MELRPVPVSNCHANCQRCGLPTEFQFFESGAGGDFSTFLGGTTGQLYRVACLKQDSEAAAVNEIAKDEGGTNNVIRIPEDIRCKLCGGILATSHISIDSEAYVQAVLL